MLDVEFEQGERLTPLWIGAAVLATGSLVALLIPRKCPVVEAPALDRVPELSQLEAA